MIITLEDVKSYLAHSSHDEYVGEPMSISHCLIAETLENRYPGCDPYVDFGNTTAVIKLEGKFVYVDVEPDLAEAASKFDQFPGKYVQPVNRSELEEYMPELFGEDN